MIKVLKGGMVTDFSGTSILSNEFVVIGRASTDNLGVLLGPRAQCGPCGHRWQKVAQKNRIERIKNGQVMATQRLAKSGRAANFEPISGYLSHIF